MKLTSAQLDRIKNDWEHISGESLEFEIMQGFVYGFGSELATLRLHKKYGKFNSSKADSGYSISLKTHYFRLIVA